jgi:hypothetical protein
VIRTVLSVALAVALLGVATPAIDDARTTRTSQLVEEDLTNVVRAATDLVAREDAVPVTARGARRAVAVTLPVRSVTSAGVSYVAIGGVPDGNRPPDTNQTDVLAYRVAGGPRHVVTVGLDVRVADRDERWHVEPDAEPLVLRGTGDVQVVLTLVRLDGDPTVVVTTGAEL